MVLPAATGQGALSGGAKPARHGTAENPFAAKVLPMCPVPLCQDSCRVVRS
jgi:hypothetical protein